MLIIFWGVVIFVLFSGIGIQQVLILRTNVRSSWPEIAPNRKVSDFKYSKDDGGAGDFDAYGFKAEGKFETVFILKTAVDRAKTQSSQRKIKTWNEKVIHP